MRSVRISRERGLSRGPEQDPANSPGGTIPPDARHPRRATTAILVLAACLGAGPVPAAEAPVKTELKPFLVTIRVFDPSRGMENGQDYVLPVNSPDAEHAVASTTANAASFTKKVEGGRALPVAFTCIRVEAR